MAGTALIKLSRAYTCFKITQIIFSIFVLGLGAYIVYYSKGTTSLLNVVTGTLALLFAIYHFISHKSQKFSNWILLLVLEIVTLLLWIASLAMWIWWDYIAIEEYMEYYGEEGGEEYEYEEYEEASKLRRRHGVENHEYETNYRDWEWSVANYSSALGLCLVQCVLYCITVALLTKGVRRYRSGGRNLDYKGTYSTPGEYPARMH